MLSAPDEGNASNQYSAEAKQTSGSPYSGGTVYKGDTSAWEEQDGRDLVMTIVFSCCPSVNGADCTYTQGYWKNHSEAWPVDNLDLGYENYTKEELLSIFNEPVRGNGLISLAHQLIAAELNKAKGATAVDIQTAMNFAHALIGNNVIPPVSNSNSFQHPSITGSYASELDDYNNGVTGPGHCSN